MDSITTRYTKRVSPSIGLTNNGALPKYVLSCSNDYWHAVFHAKAVPPLKNWQKGRLFSLIHDKNRLKYTRHPYSRCISHTLLGVGMF